MRTAVVSRHTDEVELYRVKKFTVEELWFYRLAATGNFILETSGRTTPRVVLEAVPPDPMPGVIAVECIWVAKGVRRSLSAS